MQRRWKQQPPNPIQSIQMTRIVQTRSWLAQTVVETTDTSVLLDHLLSAHATVQVVWSSPNAQTILAREETMIGAPLRTKAAHVPLAGRPVPQTTRRSSNARMKSAKVEKTINKEDEEKCPKLEDDQIFLCTDCGGEKDQLKCKVVGTMIRSLRHR